MNQATNHDARIAEMTYRSVYPLYLRKVESKGRMKDELDEVIRWLTGFDDATLAEHLNSDATFEQFFPKPNFIRMRSSSPV